MKHRVLHSLSALSLLLWVAVVVLWVRSRFVQEGWSWVREAGAGRVLHAVETSRGGLRHVRIVFGPAERGRLDDYEGGWAARPLRPADSSPDPTGRLGFAWGPAAEVRLATDVRYFRWVPPIRVARVPFWSLAVVTALPPAAALARRLRSLRLRRTGRCARCGYDLRATPGRCPECGYPSCPAP